MNQILHHYLGNDHPKITHNPKLLKKCISHPLFQYEQMCKELSIPIDRSGLIQYLGHSQHQVNYRKIRYNLAQIFSYVSFPLVRVGVAKEVQTEVRQGWGMSTENKALQGQDSETMELEQSIDFRNVDNAQIMSMEIGLKGEKIQDLTQNTLFKDDEMQQNMTRDTQIIEPEQKQIDKLVILKGAFVRSETISLSDTDEEEGMSVPDIFDESEVWLTASEDNSSKGSQQIEFGIDELLE